MIVYQTNSNGVYLGPTEADPSPLEPGVWLIPGGCVEVEPPMIPPGHVAVWDGGAWSIRAMQEDEPVGPETPAPPLVPQEVSRFQAKAALAMAGKLAAAEAAVHGSGDVILQLAWAEAGTFKRNSPGIAVLAPLIELDDAGLDDLFRTAAGIVA